MKLASKLSVISALVYGIALCSQVYSADGIQLFTEVPSAQKLADVMFPQKTRSIVFTDDSGGSVVNDGDEIPSGTAEHSKESSSSAFGLLINFEFGKADITLESMEYIDAVGKMLNLEQARGGSILIEGHTDSIGNQNYNQSLSEARAKAVRDYLIQYHSIDTTRLYPVGQGERKLHDPASPEAAINRRVEFKLIQQ